MDPRDAEERALRAVALRNADAIQLARQRAEADLLRAKEALEARTLELSHSLALMRATLDATADGILVTDSAGRVVACNERFIDMWGLTRAAIEGSSHEHLDALLSKSLRDPQTFGEPAVGADADAAPATQTPDTLELTDGRVFERYSRGQQVDAQIVGRVWSYRDVTARTRDYRAAREEARVLELVAEEREFLIEAERAAREDIARVSRLKDEFLATLSHELRTPLTAILGWAKLLLRKRDDPAVLAQGVEAIERNAVAQARLIEDLLDMNRIISGKVRLDVQPADLTAVIAAALDTVRPSAQAREVRLRSVIDPRAGPISGDPNRLQQVVWNLLTNAVKFTPKGGSVDVILQRVGSHLELSVRDSGVGIAADFVPHLFDRFRQADSSITRSHGGLGLGLSIVKQLVELHGGSVLAHSEGPGCGATFVVCLPLAALRHEPDHEHPRAPSTPAPAPFDVNLRGLTVLVVDDEPDARDLLRQLLQESHAVVHTAASAREALATLQKLRPDLLLSDIGMPERDGYQLIRDVRRLAPDHGGRTPAIALTAFARSEDRTRAMLAGFQVHISKPIEPQELMATVASLAGRMG